MTTTLSHIANDLALVAQRLCQSTVKVRSRRWGDGSGVIWQSSGQSTIIITNAHVAISDTPTVELWNGQRFNAVRIHYDPEQDLAALKIATTNLTPVTVGDADKLRAGELVLAVGNPLGDRNAVTTGIIHTNTQRAVLADITLFPGNSGGALANCLGQVVGINTMIVNGLAVAIPGFVVQRFLRSSPITEVA
jgi:serine protease Do